MLIDGCVELTEFEAREVEGGVLVPLFLAGVCIGIFLGLGK